MGNRAHATIAALLERMGVASAVVTADARLIDSSSLMVRRLRIGGVLERGLGNRLTSGEAQSAARLHQAIASVAAGRSGEAFVPVCDGVAVQLVAVMPAREGQVIVVMQDLARPEPLQEILISALGLTKTIPPAVHPPSRRCRGMFRSLRTWACLGGRCVEQRPLSPAIRGALRIRQVGAPCYAYCSPQRFGCSFMPT